MLLNPYEDLFRSRKVNINSSDSSRNLAVSVGEVAVGRSYDVSSNPSGSFRAFNLDPQVKLLSAVSVSQPLYGANLKVELNGSAGTNMSGGVSAINAYSLISGNGHVVSKNVGMSVLADVGNNLTGTTVINNFSLEVNGVASRSVTAVSNARSVSISCPNHGSNRRGLLIGSEGTTGLGVGAANRSLENLGTSNLIGAVTLGSTLTVASTITASAGIAATTAVTSGFLVAAPTFRFSTLANAPVSATAAGTQGDCVIDANFIYVCTAPNTWKRAALITW